MALSDLFSFAARESAQSPAPEFSSRFPEATSRIARGATVALHAWAIICGDKRIDRILERRRVAGELAGDRVVATDLPVEADRFDRMQGKCAALHLLDPRLDRGREVGWKGEVMPPRTSGGASEMRGIGPPCGFVTGARQLDDESPFSAAFGEPTQRSLG
jgi:hypothetical protein